MVVTMCRTETMIGQAVVIDARRIFHSEDERWGW
jgi:hypothetical protein